MYENFNEILNDLKQHSHFRNIKDFDKKDGKFIYFNGKKLLNLSSNNYLGIADNENITKEFLEFSGNRFGLGSASARLLTGTLPVYKELENTLCGLFKKEKALLFNSGYHANVGITSSIAGKNDVIFSDKLNHASIIDGMRLSAGKFFRYKHNDMESLERLLIRERKNFNNAIIVTESVFSMDGDIANLKKLVELKNKYNCLLMVDEAHAFGVFGEKGCGVCEELEILTEIDLLVGTFGKSIGSMGAFTIGNKILIEFLTNKARSFIFSTALPPISIAFSKWIIENKITKTFEKRQKMLSLGRKLGSESHIIPVIIGGNAETEEVCKRLFDAGYFTLPIRPPTVPEGTSRLRLSLTTDIEEKDLEKLCSILGLTDKITQNL
ncbi:8-amino-7-oxononanoate synthase [Candidatus Gastranaerophilales bacterium]|nr:MAG: 8-amino-7-oxononanoate synthase [Candidatus Gastranaerophilales bacterium]